MHTLKNIFVHPSHIKNFKAKEEDIIFTLASMNVDSLVRVYKQLRWMKEGLLESKTYGICSNLKIPLTGVLEEYQYVRQTMNLMQLWKHYSGNKVYPVPAWYMNGPRDAQDIYEATVSRVRNKFNDKDLMWSSSTRYGRMRHNLLNFLIACFYMALKERASYMAAEIKFED